MNANKDTNKKPHLLSTVLGHPHIDPKIEISQQDEAEDSSFLPTIGGTTSPNPSTSPRIRRLASHLSVIQISLNPPSPPESQFYSPAEQDEKYSPWFSFEPHRQQFFRPIDDAFLLQVPRLSDLGDDGDSSAMVDRSSPPPRRCSYASTYSENSSVSLNTSYQSLLFAPHSPTSRSRTQSYSYSDDNDTPPTNESAFVYSPAKLVSSGATTPRPQGLDHHSRKESFVFHPNIRSNSAVVMYNCNNMGQIKRTLNSLTLRLFYEYFPRYMIE